MGELCRPNSLPPRPEGVNDNDVVFAYKNGDVYDLDMIKDQYLTPQPIEAVPTAFRRKELRVFPGGAFALVLASDKNTSSVFAVGRGYDGELGLGDNDCQTTLTEVSLYFCIQ